MRLFGRWFGSSRPQAREVMLPSFEAPLVSAPGTPRHGGALATDQRLDVRAQAVKAREIKRTEPRIASASGYFGASLARLTWDWEAGDNASPAAARNRDYMRKLCGLGHRYRRGMLDTPWTDVIAGAAQCRDGGFITADVMPLRREDGLVWPRGVRFPAVDAVAPSPWDENPAGGDTIRVHAPNGCWSVDVTPGDLLRICQQGPSGESGAFEPYRALHFRDGDATAAEWDGGGGRLRPCLPFYDLARVVFRTLGIAVERFGAGCVRVIEDRAKGRSMGYSDAEITEATQRMMTVAEQISVGSRTALLDVAGVRVETFDPGFDPGKLLAVYDFAVRAMRAAYAAAVLDVNSGSGSYNSGSILARAFATQVGGTAQHIADVFNGRRAFQGALFRGLWDSYGPQRSTDVPMLVHRGVVEPLWADLAPVIGTLLQAGVDERRPRLLSRMLSDVGLPGEDVADLSDEWTARQAEGSLAAADMFPAIDEGAPPRVELAAMLRRQHEQAVADSQVGAEAVPREYTARTRDVARTLGVSPSTVGQLVRRGQQRGIDPPSRGSGYFRRWVADPEQLFNWLEDVTERDEVAA